MNDTDRIYDALDDIREKLSTINIKLGERLSEAEGRIKLLEQLRTDCRLEVIAMHNSLRGNGVTGWFRRIEALESAAKFQSKWFWLILLSGQSVVVATISTVIARLAS